MLGVLAGFVTIGAVIAVGMLLAQFKVLDVVRAAGAGRGRVLRGQPGPDGHGAGLDRHVAVCFSANLIASLAGVVVSALLYVLLARLVWRRTAGDTVIGTFRLCYVNAGNLGLPIAAYALGDASLVAPMLLTQLLVLQPSAWPSWTPDPADCGRRAAARRIRRRLIQPFRNPLLVGSLLGLLLSVTGDRSSRQ